MRGSSKKALLTEEFRYEDFLERYGKTALPLCIFRSEHRLEICVAGKPHKPTAGQTVLALVDPPTTSATPTETWQW